MKFSPIQIFFAAIRKLIFGYKSKGALSFGRNVYIGKGCSITGIYNLSIGDNIYIGKNVTIEVEGTIGNDCLFANNVGIIGKTDHDLEEGDKTIFFSTPVRKRKSLSSPVIIGDDVWVGFGAVILSGVRIGDGAVIAAGAVVVSDVESNVIVGGNPARFLKRRR